MKKVCGRCAYFAPDEQYEGFGSCAMTLDSNDGMAATNLAYGWDYDGYMSGVYVGKDFGCIHWTKGEVA